MSALGEIYVTIRAVNEATPEFEAISSDAARMASDVSGSSSPIQASFNEVGVAATEMGVNVKESATSFDEMSTHAEASMVSLRTVAGGIRTTAMMGTELTTLAADFGLVDRETSKYLRTIMVVIMLVSTCARMYNFLTIMTTGQTAAVAIEGTTETATAEAVTASGIAHSIKTAITWAATAAQNALNISHATFLALTGVGIGVIIAAAAAMAIFASQMNAATASVKEYNATAAETPEHTRGITRAGEQAMYRRGVE